MITRTLALAAALALAAIPSASASARPSTPPPAPTHAFIEQGERSAAPVTIPVPPPNAFVEEGVRTPPSSPAPAGGPATLPVRPQLGPDDPPPPPTKEECRSQPDAETRPGDLSGWYKNRYSWCAWGEFAAQGRDVGTGQVRANFDADFTVIGYGNNGARQFDYLVYLEDIDYTGADVNWVAATVKVSFAGCNTSMTCPNTSRLAAVPAWQAANTAAFTFTSAEVAGAGIQLVGATMTLNIDFATPTQPEWVWGAPAGLDVATSPIRYDSASYVGRARGAVFPDYRLVLTVDLKQANQNESALHILQAFDRPQLTFPSWVGKSVPGKTEPLTRMYNDSAKDSNRRKSEAMCTATFGPWDSNLDNCDEFPFASTYEGSRTGPDTYHWGERYSVRLIDRIDNQHVGNQLLEVDLYRAQRVLDGDKFYVTVLQ
ncbi:NucA/NucB deoxyribonuclease domain-containing protein [Actinoplanes sp. NPDC049118]|uniref:NucA/NucB deoxyribonuclease domain-containing protein n=1 Tax=Actinoplanes sp. NPDC049118 TaxID=3155769 RepID=UPI0033CB7155